MSNWSAERGQAYIEGMYKSPKINSTTIINMPESNWTKEKVDELCKGVSESVTSLVASINEVVRNQKKLNLRDCMMKYSQLNVNISDIFGKLSSFWHSISSSEISIPQDFVSEMNYLLGLYVSYCSIEDYKKYIIDFISFVRDNDDIEIIRQEYEKIKSLIPFTLGDIMGNIVPLQVKDVLCDREYVDEVKLNNKYTIKREKEWKMTSTSDGWEFVANLDINYSGNIYTPLEYFDTDQYDEREYETLDPFGEGNKITRTHIEALPLPKKYIENARNNYQSVCVIDDISKRAISFLNSNKFIEAYHDAYFKYYSEFVNRLSSFLSKLQIYSMNLSMANITFKNFDVIEGHSKK